MLRFIKQLLASYFYELDDNSSIDIVSDSDNVSYNDDETSVYIPLQAPAPVPESEPEPESEPAEDPIASQALELLSPQYLLVRSRNKYDYDILQKQLISGHHALEKWLRANQWSAFLDALYALHDSHESVFYYWTKWGLQTSSFGEALLVNKELQQQISEHPHCVDALFAIGENSLTALHWLFLARVQKKPRLYLNVFLHTLSQAIPDYSASFMMIFLQPFSYQALEKCLLEHLVESAEDLDTEFRQLFSPRNQDCLIKQLPHSLDLLGRPQLVICLEKIQTKHPRNIFFAQLGHLNTSKLFENLPLLISSQSKSIIKKLIDVFTIDNFAKRWELMRLSKAYLKSIIQTIESRVFDNVDERDERYLLQLFSVLCAHPQIVAQLDRKSKYSKYAKLKNWLYPKQQEDLSSVSSDTLLVVAHFERDLMSYPDDPIPELEITSASPVLLEENVTPVVDLKIEFETLFETIGTYYTDTSSGLPDALKKMAHQWFICNDDSLLIERLLDKLVIKWGSSLEIHPLYAQAKDCLQKKPLDIVMAKYYCLCLQVNDTTYDLLECSYIVALINYFNQSAKKPMARVFRNMADWVSQADTAYPKIKKLRWLVYDLVWFSPLIEDITSASQKVVQTEIVPILSLDILKRGNDLFGLVCRSEYSANRLIPSHVVKKLKKTLPSATEDEQCFAAFLNSLFCFDQSRVYGVGSRFNKDAPFAAEERGDFDIDIHWCDMPSHDLEDVESLAHLTFEWLKTRVEHVWPKQNIIRCANGAFNQHYLWFSYKVNCAHREMDFRFLCSDFSPKVTRIFSQSERCFSERASVWSFKDNIVYGFSGNECEVTKPEESFTYNNVCYLLRCVVKIGTLQTCSPRVIDIINQVIQRYELNAEDKRRINYIWYEQTKNKSNEGTAGQAIQVLLQMQRSLLGQQIESRSTSGASSVALPSSVGSSPLTLFGSVETLTPTSPEEIRAQRPPSGGSITSSVSSMDGVRAAF